MHMSEKPFDEKQIEQDAKDKKATEKENKLLRLFLPIVGIFAFILGILGFILTLGKGNVGVTVIYAILFLLGLLGILYGVLLIIRKKRPDFLKKKKAEQADTLLD